MVVLEILWGRFMKKFRFDTICNITQEPQEVKRFSKLCPLVDQQICYDKILVIAVKSYKY